MLGTKESPRGRTDNTGPDFATALPGLVKILKERMSDRLSRRRVDEPLIDNFKTRSNCDVLASQTQRQFDVGSAAHAVEPSVTSDQ